MPLQASCSDSGLVRSPMTTPRPSGGLDGAFRNNRRIRQTGEDHRGADAVGLLFLPRTVSQTDHSVFARLSVDALRRQEPDVARQDRHIGRGEGLTAPGS